MRQQTNGKRNNRKTCVKNDFAAFGSLALSLLLCTCTRTQIQKVESASLGHTSFVLEAAWREMHAPHEETQVSHA